jgi:capsule polysaccharide export protein KpsE/RkpR
VVEYKEYMRSREEAEKEYQEKVGEARNELEEARKKCEEFEIPEEDATPEQ